MKSFSLQDSSADEWAHNGPSEADYCSRDGAVALKEKIEAYWRARGQDVMLSLHNVGFHPAIRAARFDVRSDMVNGLPRAALGAPRRAENHLRIVSSNDADGDDFDDEIWLDP